MLSSQDSPKPVIRERKELFELNLKQYIGYLPVFIVCCILAVAAAYIYYKNSPKLYEISASVLINDQRKGTDDAKMLDALDVFKERKIVENEIEILRSKHLLEYVVENLGLYVDIYTKKNYQHKNLYTESPIKIRIKDLSKIVPVEGVAFSFDEQKREVVIGKDHYSLNKWHITPYGELIFLSNSSYKEENAVDNLFFSISNLNSKVEQLSLRLEVGLLNRLTSVVSLKIQDSDPSRGEDILNELMLQYGKAEVDEKNILAGNILESVENRLQFVSGQLDSVENEIQRYRSSAGIYDISEQGRLYLENVGQFDKEMERVTIELSVLNEVEKYLLSKNSSATGAPIGVSVDDPGLKQLLDDLNESQIEFDKLSKTTGENSPILQTQKERIARLKPSILDYVSSKRNGLTITKNNLAKSSGRYSSMLSTIPNKEKQLIEISRQQSIKNEIFSYLLQRREEAALSYAAAKPDSRIIDKAQSSEMPVKPRLIQVVIPALLIGALLPFAFLYMIDNFGKTIKFRKDIRKKLDVGIPIIGELFYDRAARQFKVDDQESLMSGEQIKKIRNWLFALAGKTGQSSLTVQITSYTRKEGKSFITLNLARSMSAAGRKVLIIDLNQSSANNPTSHFELAEKPGISDYLIGKQSINACIHPVANDANIKVLPVGTGDLSRIELLAGHKMEQCLSEFKKQYDFILINSDSLLRESNTISISAMTDQTIVVIRHGVTLKNNLAMPPEASGIALLKSPVLIFNGVRRKGFFGAGYGFGVGYGYDLKS